MISLSTVVWKIEPRASSSSRSCAALVRLPLWAMAIWPARAIHRERLRVAQSAMNRSSNNACGRRPCTRPDHAESSPLKTCDTRPMPLVDCGTACRRRSRCRRFPGRDAAGRRGRSTSIPRHSDGRKRRKHRNNVLDNSAWATANSGRAIQQRSTALNKHQVAGEAPPPPKKLPEPEYA